MPHDVFVSYSSADKPTADAVCATLENRGIRCWIAPRDVVPGTEWGGAIIDAINGCRVMVLVYSASANNSNQIKREVERAVNRGVPIIPFRIENVPMSKTLEYFISTPHWLDALSGPLNEHLERLATTTALILTQEGVTIAAPPPGAAAPRPPIARPLTSSQDIVRGIGSWVKGGAESPTLSQVFVPRSDRIANAAFIAGSVVLLAILAQIKIGPIWLLPLGVVLAGAVLGSKGGAMAVGGFVVLGILGMRVFGDGLSAWTVLPDRVPYAQHALGFLAGLIGSAYVVGWLAERRSWDRSVPTAALLGLIGAAIVYVPGLIWVEVVALFMRQARSQTALLPSMPMLVITVIVITVALPVAWRWVLEREQAGEAAQAPEAPPVGAASGPVPSPPEQDGAASDSRPPGHDV